MEEELKNKITELEAALADTRLVLGKKVVQLEQTLSMLDKLQKQNIELISKLEDAELMSKLEAAK